MILNTTRSADTMLAVAYKHLSSALLRQLVEIAPKCGEVEPIALTEKPHFNAST